MNERRKIEDRIKKKEAEIQSLSAQISEARIYIQALNDVLKMLPRESPTGSEAPPALRAGSSVAIARELILKKGEPLHINALLEGMGKEITRDARSALAGSLAAYVRRGEIFTRPAPNSFGLVELPDAIAVPPGPPDDFGDLDDEVPF